MRINLEKFLRFTYRTYIFPPVEEFKNVSSKENLSPIFSPEKSILKLILPYCIPPNYSHAVMEGFCFFFGNHLVVRLVTNNILLYWYKRLFFFFLKEKMSLFSFIFFKEWHARDFFFFLEIWVRLISVHKE